MPTALPSTVARLRSSCMSEIGTSPFFAMDDEGMFGECTSIGTTERRLGTSSGAMDSAKRPATPLMIPRRAVAALTAAACSLCGLQKVTPAAPPDDVLHLPLQPTVGGVLTAGVLIDGEPFRLIVDTGSPYLVVPLDECASQPPRLSSYGCAEPGQFRASAYPPTLEQYGAGPSAGGSPPGRIEWLTGDVRFGEPELQRAGDGRLSVVVRFRQAGGRQQTGVGGELVFGGADRNVMSQSGGALLGLIREVNRDPRLSNYPVAQLRPTALAQLQMRSFRLDAPQRGGRRCRLACLTTATLHTARLVASTAQAAPTRPGAPHEQLESLPRPHKPPWCTPTRRQGARSP